MEEPNSAKIATTYDGLGRPQTVTNPYYSSTDPLYGTTTYTYDALDRKTIQAQPDGSKLQWCYDDMADQGQTNCSSQIGSVATGEWVDFTDEAGSHWQRTSDSFGRLTDVIEDANNSKLETDYTYDALGNLLRVDQWGGAHGSTGDRIRTFTYDSLSRLLCASNPENSTAQCPTTATTSYITGTIGYTYDANGNVSTKISLLPNQTGSATLTTTDTYDELNRLTAASYSDHITPGVFYAYDVAPSWSPNLQNVVGRVAYSGNSYAGGTSGYAAETAYSYDAMGRVLQKWEQTPSLSPNGDIVSSMYDLAGHVTTATTAAGTTLTYAYDVNGRVSTITSSLNDAQHPGTLYSFDSVEGYYSSGAMHKGTFGNGLTETQAFNDRLQPCRVDLNSSGTYLSHCASAAPTGDVLDYTLAYGSTDNGNVVSWSATGQQVFNRAYQYDHFNRISSMTDSASGQSCKGLSWVVDAWGNVTSQTPTGGSCFSFSTSSPGTSNRLAAYTYDAAGNVTYDGTSHYTYDALGRVLSVVNNGGTTSYVYNENGERVRKSTSSGWTEYFYGIDGNVQSEWNGSSWPNQYVYDGGRLLAIYTNGTTEFIHADHLGSTRLVTGVSQNVIDNMDYEPYGQQIAGDDSTTHKFTGKERDSESGNDYFGARYYASTTGRFLSPDPLGGHLENPQSLNKYSYVANNPLRWTDSTGLDFALDCSKNNGTSCQGGHQYYQNKQGKWIETRVSSDKNGNLADQQGNKYTGTFNGKAVTFSNAQGNKSGGDWIQGSNKTSGITGSGPLSNNFNFTFYNHGANQTLNFTFTYSGSMNRAFGELQNAGFTHWHTGFDPGFSEWRTDVAGRNSSHFLVWDPNWLEQHTMSPPSTLPQGPGTKGEGHVGEYYPGFHHTVCDVMGLC